MRDKRYSTTEMIEITGETKQRIQYWVLRNVIYPIDKGRGAGTSRGYSFGNLLEIILVQNLSQTSINIDFTKRILKHVREEKPSYFALPDNIEDRLDDVCILSVLFMSQNDIMVFVHGFEETIEVMGRYLPAGFKAFQMDLNVLKKALVERLGGDS
jgi:DNA-binding transcriptional MerR regulator